MQEVKEGVKSTFGQFGGTLSQVVGTYMHHYAGYGRGKWLQQPGEFSQYYRDYGSGQTAGGGVEKTDIPCDGVPSN